MRVLVYSSRIGPCVVFLPPARKQPPEYAEVPGREALTAPAHSQVSARGLNASWEQHCRLLVDGLPYAGTWKLEDVPDGLTPNRVLSYVRFRAAGDLT